MPKVLDDPPPLRKIRPSHLKKATEAVKVVNQHLTKPLSATYFTLLEHRGTNNRDYIKAISLGYGVDEDTVAEAARPR